MSAPLDLKAIEDEFLNQCGPCDYGMGGACNCAKRDYRSTMLDLVREVERLRAERQDTEVGTLRCFADKVAEMARVGGSPALTEALDAVAGVGRRQADSLAGGQ